MSIIVSIKGEENDSDEYVAAAELKRIIEKTAPKSTIGEILLYPSATLFGQEIKDIDLVMLGSLKNCEYKIEFDYEGVFKYDSVSVESFYATIEIKSHDITGVFREGTDWKVKYGMKTHNVTRQSNKQKEALKSFFQSTTFDTPYITNLIWFTGVTKPELNKLSEITGGNAYIRSNAFSSEVTFHELAQLLAYQRVPKFYGGRYHLRSEYDSSYGVDVFAKAFGVFDVAKKTMGNLTRKKVEMITRSELAQPLIPSGDEIIIYRGRAGTGKTIQLIRSAIRIADELDDRVLMLTYNRALVQDIRRLFAFAELPDLFNPSCVSVMTMHSFFYRLINQCLYDGKLTTEQFLAEYESALEKMLDCLKNDSEMKEIVQEICSESEYLNWDYVLIDEAQDWSLQERDLLLQMFGASHILVADGGMQFVRHVKPCDWSMIRKKKNVRMRYSLRQKKNLISFMNHLCEISNDDYNKVVSSEKMPGGKVIIVVHHQKLMQILKDEKKLMEDKGNVAYDMMMLVPSNLVIKEHGRSKFAQISEYESNGLLLWDGTDYENRLDYSISSEEIRVLQYESCRGLEGWTVCCVDFDEFLERKEKQMVITGNEDALLLESKEEKKHKQMMNWVLLPLTRPIDTLVISLKDVSSKYSKMLLNVAEEHPDYIEVI